MSCSGCFQCFLKEDPVSHSCFCGIPVAGAFLMNLAGRNGMTPGVPGFVLLLIGSIVSISLSLGFLTPFFSVIVCVTAVAKLLLGPNSNNAIQFFTIFVAAALSLLGPGAYSVDSKLFGRRVTYISLRKRRAGGKFA
jgi:hypothetical protein